MTPYKLTKEADGYYLTAPGGARQLVLTNEEATELGLKTLEEVVEFIRSTRAGLRSFKIEIGGDHDGI